jgi:hypothetical protein
MTEDKEVLTIYLGETDIYEWTQGVGKTVLMPELLVGCEEVLYNDINEVHCARIEAIVRGKYNRYDRKNINLGLGRGRV